MPKLVYAGKEYVVTSELVMGRHRDNNVQLADGRASRRHASVALRSDGTVWVQDLDSANGTKVNGEDIYSPRQLMDGDRIIIGKSTVAFHGDPPTEGQTAVPPGVPAGSTGSVAASREPGADSGSGLNPTTAASASAEIPVKPASPGRNAPPASLIGTQLGSYHLISVLRIGSLATVYRASKVSGKALIPTGDGDTAVKVFHAEVVARDTGFAQRLREDSRRAHKVDHPGIVKVIECSQQDKLLWYSMDLIESDTLEDVLARDSKVDPWLALSCIEQVAQVMQAAHARKLLHGDLSPANILLTRQGTIHLLDLGLVAALASVNPVGRKGNLIEGNPWYLSPEKVQGQPGDQRSDIYSLGCILVHLLTGEPPFDEDSTEAIRKSHLDKPIPSIREKLPNLPTKIDDVIKSMLSKNPEWRYATMTEVITDLVAARKLLPERTASSFPTALNTAFTAPAAPATPPKPISTPAVYQAAAERAQERLGKGRGLRKATPWYIAAAGVVLLVLWLLNRESATAALDSIKPPEDVHWQVTTPGHPTTPPVVQSTPGESEAGNAEAVTAVATAGPAGQWHDVQQEVDREVQAKSWGAAELTLQNFADALAKHPDANLLQSVHIKQSQLSLDGGAWYRREIAALPVEIAPRLVRIGEIRDVAMSGEHAEAEELYQETLAKLVQLLQSKQRLARQQLEAGHVEHLRALASDLAPSFSGTPVEGLQRQFALLAKEASQIAWSWRGDWHSTRDQLLHATNANALAAGAILILTDDPAAAKTLVMSQPALTSGDLLTRREQLFGREAAILSFTNPTDLQYIESLQGDLHLDSVAGALSGSPGELIELACTVPVGGENWEVAMTLSVTDQPGKAAEAIITCVNKEGNPAFKLIISHDDLVCAFQAQSGNLEQRFPHPAVDPMLLRIACRANHLEVRLNNALLTQAKDAHIPSGCQVRLEVADARWQLRRLQVVGGG